VNGDKVNGKTVVMGTETTVIPMGIGTINVTKMTSVNENVAFILTLFIV